jgi:poly-gamma-glutamate synthesis protein (capsule biosynthesis protein)
MSVQREWAKQFFEAGATLVVGNHPHLIQPIEQFQNGIVFYSLGNFVFDQPERARRESVVLQAVFEGANLQSWSLMPAYINYYTMQTHWAGQNDDPEKILERAYLLGQ